MAQKIGNQEQICILQRTIKTLKNDNTEKLYSVMLNCIYSYVSHNYIKRLVSIISNLSSSINKYKKCYCIGHHLNFLKI